MLGPIPFSWHTIESKPQTCTILERLNSNLQVIRVGELKAANKPSVVASDVPHADCTKPGKRLNPARKKTEVEAALEQHEAGNSKKLGQER